MLRAAAALPRVRPLPRSPRGLVWIAALVALLAAGLLWFRDSSFVRVEKVVVTGLSGPEAPKVQALLSDAARDMTTLHVDEGQLRAIVEPYPVVEGLEVESDFPHGLRIVVHERTPVAVVADGESRTPVAADGTLLRGAAPRDLAVVPLRVAPAGDRISDRRTRLAVAALAAAPEALRERVTRASFGRDGGLVLDLADGPDLRFGTGDRLAAKWAAATAVLADESSAGAVYLANSAVPPAASTTTPAPAPVTPTQP
ncbi:MAG: FtsQ-type POTRA domain-containing protein [Solirubrobacterales bacterium]|nr:FtsQ-type POTRA domain-containing protein [Solirubrobacterales bacterium]